MSHPRSGRTPLIALLAIVALGAVILLITMGGSGPDRSAEGGTGGVLDRGVDEERPEAAGLTGEAPSREPVERAPVESPTPLGGVVRGTIVNSLKEPVESVRVILTQRRSNTTMWGETGWDGEAIQPLSFTKLTDGNGNYAFDQLPMDTVFDMWLYHPQYAPTLGIPVTPVKGEEQVMRAIVLQDGFKLEGRVTDEGGNPIQADLEATMQENDFHKESSDRMREQYISEGRILLKTCDENGYFEFGNMAEGIWSLYVKADGFATEKVHPLVLMEGRVEPFQNVTLGPAYHLAGNVKDPVGNPVPLARVHAARVSPRPLLDAKTKADEQGYFNLGGLEEGLWSMSIVAEGFSNSRLQRIKPNRDDLEVVMQHKGGASGRVLDPEGRPVTRFTIELKRIHRSSKGYGWTGWRKTFEDPEGNYVITDQDPGTYIALVRARGFAPTYSPGFRIERKVEQGIDVQLQYGGKIVGRVDSANLGVPLPGTEVILRGADYREEPLALSFGGAPFDPNNVPVMVARVENDGTFEILNAYPGAHKLEVRHPTHLTEWVPVQVDEHRETDIGTVHLREGGTVAGKAVTAQGIPLAGGTVYLNLKQSDGTGTFYAEARTVDALGRFRFDALEAGVYEIGASSYESEGFDFLFEADQSQQEVVVREGETVSITISIG